jgi:TonB family protein
MSRYKDYPFAPTLLGQAVRPRPASLLGSACLHAAVLFLLLHVPAANPRALRMEDYSVLPPPSRDRKLVWYKLDSRMPDVSVGRRFGPRPPQARVRSKDVSIQASTPDAPARDQLIFQPAAPAELPKSLPLPNMAAFQPAPPPEPTPPPTPEPPKLEMPAAAAPDPPKRTVRAFTPPPAPAPRKPRPIELAEAPIDALPNPAALGQLTAIVAGVKPMPGAPPALPEGSRPASVSVGPAAGSGAGGALNPSPASGVELISSGGGPGGLNAKPSFVPQTVLFTRADIEQRRGAVSVPVRLAMVPESARKFFGDRTVYLTFLEKPNPRHYTGDILLWFAERGQTAAGGQSMHAPVPFRQTDPFGPNSRSPRAIRGTLRLAAVISADGFLSDLRVLESPDDALDAPLLEAAAKWTFLPALRGPARVAVDALFEIPVAFLPSPPLGAAPAASR